MKPLAVPQLRQVALAALFMAAPLAVLGQTPLGTAFTYQGQLKQAGQPFNGQANMVFQLYDAGNAGNLLGTQTLNGVGVSGGLFTVVLDFGAGAFDGEARWLQVTVNGTPLAPRQTITAAPYALSLAPGATIYGGANGLNALTLYHSDVFTSAIYALHTATGGTALYGESDSGAGAKGVWGASSEGVGVYGGTDTGAGGVYGQSNGGPAGVQGANTTGDGVQGVSSGRNGVFGSTDAVSPSAGVWGTASSANGTGVFGDATAATGPTMGGFFQTDSTSGYGVYGYAPASSGTTYGVYGDNSSSEGTGVFGVAGADSGLVYGVYGQTYSSDGWGVYGVASSTSGGGTGGEFRSDGPGGIGVAGRATFAGGSTYGLYGVSYSTDGIGAVGTALSDSGSAYGMLGQSYSTSGRGVYGYAAALTGFAYGVWGVTTSTNGNGVVGQATAPSGATYGVVGEAFSPTGTGVYGSQPSASGWAVFAAGRLGASGTKSFRIDHPLDPENKYLLHYSTEAPEPLNAYSGNVVTDSGGYAKVTLPDYFEEINKDFRYQLTVVDDGERADFIMVKVVQKINNGEFTIRTSQPSVEVSWRVEATRNDRWMKKYGAPAEVEKDENERGKYQHPELYGQPPEMGMNYEAERERQSHEHALPPAVAKPSN